MYALKQDINIDQSAISNLFSNIRSNNPDTDSKNEYRDCLEYININ